MRWGRQPMPLLAHPILVIVNHHGRDDAPQALPVGQHPHRPKAATQFLVDQLDPVGGECLLHSVIVFFKGIAMVLCVTSA